MTHKPGTRAEREAQTQLQREASEVASLEAVAFNLGERLTLEKKVRNAEAAVTRRREGLAAVEDEETREEEVAALAAEEEGLQNARSMRAILKVCLPGVLLIRPRSSLTPCMLCHTGARRRLKTAP
jgi:hypothetical protein